MVQHFFQFVADDVRDLLAGLGARSLHDLVGRTELLEVLPGTTDKQRKLDLSRLIATAVPGVAVQDYCAAGPLAPGPTELALATVHDTRDAIALRSGGHFRYAIRNVDRAIGGRLSGEIARTWGDQGMTDAPLTLELHGSAGQSFGAWNVGGLHLVLTGEANDGVGKGMAGGRIVVRPADGVRFASQDASIIGNTCLYGATGGELFAAGRAGERFAVRNSGAVAVVEGVGDHACEYMTGGTIVVLGRSGLNFGAGMTGGFAYVLDLERNFFDRYNHELVDINRISLEGMENHLQHLRALMQAHIETTGSAWTRQLFSDFRDVLHKVWLVKPKAASLAALNNELRESA
jgi:glutamate synthase (NADPH/NADH) large chain